MPSFKDQLVKKFLKFQQDGLKQYGKYLNDQLKMYKNKGNAAAYVKDIERQIADKEKKLLKIAQKLKG